MLTNELLTIILVFLNVLFFLWMFVIGLYHYFLHQEHTAARALRMELEKAVDELMAEQRRLAEETDVAMLRCKLNGCNHNHK